MELDPGGGQRGPVLDLGTFVHGYGYGEALVSADGERALLVYSVAMNGVPTTPTAGVHSLPLACAAH